MSTASLWHRCNSFLRYLYFAKSRHGVHSPFIYNLVEKVLRDSRYYPAYDSITDLRHFLENNNQWFSKCELGAGSNSRMASKRLLGHEARYSGIPAGYGKLLYRIVQYFKPRFALELGTSLGLSAFYQAAAMTEIKNPNFVSIEGCPETYLAATRNLETIGRVLDFNHFVEFRLGDFNNELPKVLAQWPRLDYVFIDGDHREERLLSYFNLCLQKVHQDSVIIVDDIYWSKGMTRAWEIIKQMPQVMQTIDLYRMGMVFFRKGAAKQHFILKY